MVKEEKQENRGSIEFQVFNFTNKIWRLVSHLELQKKDFSLERGLQTLLEKHQRLQKLREAKVTFEGLVMEALPNGMFRVRLENDMIILGYILGKIRSSSIRILMGDRVKIEVSRYDSSKGRIIYRLPP